MYKCPALSGSAGFASHLPACLLACLPARLPAAGRLPEQNNAVVNLDFTGAAPAVGECAELVWLGGNLKRLDRAGQGLWLGRLGRLAW